ncbi:GNAT family N-acetyltransferase [Bordetella genomosp. 10]|uniref:GNAT family N-acetyltransferase n=1 Tax=Bordetella genomosp. 10 TaxID=1416804 RepID=A0A261S2H2_9BORD|nr:GNAT family N-acetyltransferase [Bordetella genomosp. 10]OZI30683.1 GNAT family N-acetyltransferase [Bordetella genomosp. 10]
MTVTTRPIAAADRARWQELFDAYTRFYEREPDAAVSNHAWARIMDPASPVHAIVAECSEHGVIGIANYILHDNTWTLTPVCYLQDLFVDPKIRAQGVGQQLIDWLVAKMKSENWSRLYWNTKENNYRARGLYDKYTPHSGFLRYVVNNG